MTLGNVDGEMGGLTISDPQTQAEVQALHDKCEELADDVRALSTSACHAVVRVVNDGGFMPFAGRRWMRGWRLS